MLLNKQVRCCYDVNVHGESILAVSVCATSIDAHQVLYCAHTAQDKRRFVAVARYAAAHPTKNGRYIAATRSYRQTSTTSYSAS